MRRLRELFPVGFWGVVLVVLSAVALAFHPDTMTTALGFGGAAAALVAGVSVLRSRWAGGDAGAAPLPDLSVATVVMAVGFSVAVYGAEVGAWLVGIGAGTVAAGLGGLARELRAERREKP